MQSNQSWFPCARRHDCGSAASGLAHSDCVFRDHCSVQIGSNMVPTKVSDCGNAQPTSNADFIAGRWFPDKLLLSDVDSGCFSVNRRGLVFVFRV